MGTEQGQKAPSLADIIYRDAANVVNSATGLANNVFHNYTLRGLARGASHGLYTPFLLTTGIRWLNKAVDEYDSKEVETGDYRFVQKGVSDIIGQFMGALLSQVPIVFNASSNGIGKEYFGALIATNIVDYLINAYRRRSESGQ